MNDPISSKFTDKIESMSFPAGSIAAQKMKFYNVANVHKQGGVVRDAAFYQPVLYNVDWCQSGVGEQRGMDGTVSDIPLGNGKVISVLNPSSPNPTVVGTSNNNMVMSPVAMRNLFYIGVGLLGLALILAVVNYFAPRVFGRFGGYVVGLVGLLVLVGVIFIVMDRTDTF